MLSPTRRSLCLQRGARVAKAGGNVFVRSPGGEVARELVRIVQDTERGLATTRRQREAIEACVTKLQVTGEGRETTGPEMSATWKMIWTTEKETLFVLKHCGIFGKAAGDAFQVIDVGGGWLQNIIELNPDSVFGVDSRIDVTSPQRLEFVFERAFYQEAGKPPFNLPPYGKGWLENIYMDEELRVARDIRRDTLITVRSGPPRRFP